MEEIVICRHRDGTETKLQDIHQIEITIDGETFWVYPYGDKTLRVTTNKKVNIEQAINGVTIHIDKK